ncbi:hypothetical protein ACQUQP_03895 [Marinobacterium sp. YM272]|uniref:hypothetical protein n=1 Tax=Marinobacterium sp. YM272 TaxID=3421654 RepID=UPI003D7F6F87
MSITTLVADAALLAAAAGSALWSNNARQQDAPHSVLLGAWSLSSLFVLLAVVATWLPGESTDMDTLRRLGVNLGIYAGMPMLATAVYALGKRLFWSAAGWGRLLLGFFALFELNRQLGYGQEYTNVLGAATAIGVFSGALFLGNTRARLFCAASALLLAAAMAFTGNLPLPLAPQPTLFSLLAALGLGLLTLAARLELVTLNQPSQ